MKRNSVAFACLAFTVIAFSVASAQDKGKRPSPPANAQCTFSDGKTVTIDYSSPRAKGRKIYGGLVPFGEVWRTGANEATTFVTNTDVSVGGKDVPAGSYTIFTVPNQDKWTLIVNKKTGEWGIPYKWEGDELLRTDMMVSSTPSAVEDLTIGFDQKGDSCSLHVDWENTRASVDVSEKK
ncbi:MAG: DUF2911 domain-containing protein [Terriglobales bacterium]